MRSMIIQNNSDSGEWRCCHLDNSTLNFIIGNTFFLSLCFKRQYILFSDSKEKDYDRKGFVMHNTFLTLNQKSAMELWWQRRPHLCITNYKLQTLVYSCRGRCKLWSSTTTWHWGWGTKGVLKDFTPGLQAGSRGQPTQTQREKQTLSNTNYWQIRIDHCWLTLIDPSISPHFYHRKAGGVKKIAEWSNFCLCLQLTPVQVCWLFLYEFMMILKLGERREKTQLTCPAMSQSCSLTGFPSTTTITEKTNRALTEWINKWIGRWRGHHLQTSIRKLGM